MRVGDRTVEVAVTEDEVSRLQLGTNVLVNHLRIPGDIEQELGDIGHAQKTRIPRQVTNRLGYFGTKHPLVPGVMYGNPAINKVLRDTIGKGRLSTPVNSLEIDEDRLHFRWSTLRRFI